MAVQRFKIALHDVTIDVDECATEQDQCDQNCHNNIGSFSCSCNSGFMLSSDGLNCDGKCNFGIIML